MLATRPNDTNNVRLPLLLPNLGDTSQRQQKNQQQLLLGTPGRPISHESIQSIDNAYSLEHLFVALRRRIRRIIQTYNVKSFHDALKMCARLFQSYASYNLNTIDEFARRLNKNARDNKKILTLIDQFRLQLSELRHCHSTFEAELLVTTLAIDFHEDNSENQQTSLLLATGKFSPRSRLSKFRVQHIRQAIELKSQLKQINECLQVLLFDEFNANLSNLWDESDRYISASVPFHDHHVTYVLRLIPDIVLKFEYALQLCTKLFDIETTMLENYPPTSRSNNNNTNDTNNNKNNDDDNTLINNNVNNKNKNNSNIIHNNQLNINSNYHHHHNNNDNDNYHQGNNESFSATTPVTMMTLTSRTDDNQAQRMQEIPTRYKYERNNSNKNSRKPLTFFSAEAISVSSVSPVAKSFNTLITSTPFVRHAEPLDAINQLDDDPMLPPLFSATTAPMNDKSDQNKLRLLIVQLEKRLTDEESYRNRLLNCIKQTEKKLEQLNRFPKTNMLTLVISHDPSVAEYQRELCLSDYQIHKSVADELNIAIKETQHRIDWINMIRTRARQCLD